MGTNVQHHLLVGPPLDNLYNKVNRLISYFLTSGYFYHSYITYVRMPHFDFIEIGTSDFDTLVESATDDQIGLCVEPLGHMFFDRLPSRPNVIKDCCAVSDSTGTIKMFYLDLEDIKEQKFPTWVRGCNSVNVAHPQIVRLLQKSGLEHLQRSKEVAVKSYGQLMRDHNVGTVSFLKLDTEGHDPIILKSVLEYCLSEPKAFPDKIQFESNGLANRQREADIIREFCAHGYQVWSKDKDTVLMKDALFKLEKEKQEREEREEKDE